MLRHFSSKGFMAMLVAVLLLSGAAPAGASDRTIVILVADLGGDADHAGTEELLAALGGIARIEARRAGPLDDLEAQPPATTPRREQALLEERRAELLIRGRVSASGAWLALRLRAAEGAIGMDAAHGGVREVRLSRQDAALFAATLRATALTMLEPASTGQAEALFAAAMQAAQVLARSLDAAPEALDGAERARRHHALGLALATIAIRRRDLTRLEQAARHLGRAAALTQSSSGLSARATVQSDLGEALALLGDQEQGSQRLEQAAAAYRAALAVWSAEASPLRWAGAQAGLGAALTSLAARQAEGASLDPAIAAYRAAAAALESAGLSARWARVQNRIGAILLRQGIAESGRYTLGQAAAAFRAALARQDRKTAPLDWAMTQSNLGSALANLGEREGGTARLEEARSALTEALATFRDLGYDDYAQRVRWNLRRVDAVLEERR